MLWLCLRIYALSLTPCPPALFTMNFSKEMAGHWQEKRLLLLAVYCALGSPPAGRFLGLGPRKMGASTSPLRSLSKDFLGLF